MTSLRKCTNSVVVESLEGRRLLTTYSITDLGLDRGTSAGLDGTALTGVDINTKGAVAATGKSELVSINPDAVELLPKVSAPGFEDPLHVPGLTQSFSKGLNDKGDIVGQITDTKGTPHAFISQLGTGNVFAVTDLGVLPKLKGAIAYAINNKRQAVGSSGNLTGKESAFFWERNAKGKGVLTALPKLVKSLGFITTTSSIALAINDAGVIAGSAFGKDFQTHAVLWQRKGTKFSVVDIKPPGRIAGSQALAINTKGFVTGTFTSVSGFTPHGFVRGAFTPGKVTYKTINALAGFTTPVPEGINSKNVVVGHMDSATGGDAHAFMWKFAAGKATMIDLNTLLPDASGWVVTEATSINTAGQIVGIGKHNGSEATFILSPDA